MSETHPEFNQFETAIAAVLIKHGFTKEKSQDLSGFESDLWFRNSQALQLRFSYQRREGQVSISLGAPNLISRPVVYTHVLSELGLLSESRLEAYRDTTANLSDYFAGLVQLVQDTLPKVLREFSTPSGLEALAATKPRIFPDVANDA